MQVPGHQDFVKATRGLFVLFGFLICLFTGVQAQTPAVEDVAPIESVPINFELRRVGSIELISLQRDNEVFLPVRAMFDFLRIKHVEDLVANTVSGFFVTPDTPYVINVAKGVIQVGKRSVALTPADVITKDNETYVRVAVFDRAFGLPISYRPRELRASLTTDLALPVFLDQRLRHLELELERRRGIPPSEFEYGRTFAILDGARMDYLLRQTVSAGTVPNRVFFTRVTGHVLGGDASASFNGDLPPYAKMRQTRAFWRFVPRESSSLFRQATVGDFVTSGFLSREIYGLEITSRPPAPRILFADQSFAGTLIPERNAYFYDNYRLQGVQQPDPTGAYNFATTLRYGVNLVDINGYSEWGELTARSYRLFVPFTLVPPREIDYDIQVCRLRGNGDPWYGEASAYWGATSRLTVGTRMEYYAMETLPTQVFPTLEGISRIGDYLIGDVIVSPNALYRGRLDLTLPSLIGGSISATQYRRNVRLFNPRNAVSEIAASGVLPFSINGSRFALDGTFQQTVLELSRERFLLLEASAYIGAVSPRILSRWSWSHTYEINTTFLTLHETEPLIQLRLPGNLYLATSVRYDHIRAKVVDTRLAVVAQPLPPLTLDFSAERFYQLNSNIYRFRAQYLFPSIRTQAFVTSSGRSVFHSQAISGSLGYAPQTSKFIFDYYGSRAVYGGILVTPFLDENNNGIRDAGEEILSTARLRASKTSEIEGTSMMPIPGLGWGTVRATPYQKYTIELDRTSLENPLWIPKYKVVDATASPGRFTYIELPVVTGGAVRGTVQIEDKGVLVGVEGIRVRIRETGTSLAPGRELFEQTVTTFSTGDYEINTVPPGTYEVSLDPKQLSLSHLSAVQISRQVTIEAKRDGDFVENVNFQVAETE